LGIPNVEFAGHLPAPSIPEAFLAVDWDAVEEVLSPRSMRGRFSMMTLKLCRSPFIRHHFAICKSSAFDFVLLRAMWFAYVAL
jgi:hypothetical protein